MTDESETVWIDILTNTLHAAQLTPPQIAILSNGATIVGDEGGIRLLCGRSATTVRAAPWWPAPWWPDNRCKQCFYSSPHRWLGRPGGSDA
jgi:hypothetical protein